MVGCECRGFQEIDIVIHFFKNGGATHIAWLFFFNWYLMIVVILQRILFCIFLGDNNLMKSKITTLLFCAFFMATFAQQNKIKSLLVKSIKCDEVVDLEKVSNLLEANTQLEDISELNWTAYPYRPIVKFRIAHCDNQIWLKFYVQEKYVLAKRTETNSDTHRDSCVEFFLDPKEDGNYYNFEVNSIGTMHLAYGPNIGKRSFIDPETIRDQIKINATLGDRPFDEIKGEQKWEITLVIPSDIFIHDKGIQLGGLKAKANFYKCGDDTSIPHYLSWNPVGTSRPNFHTPAFFGTLIFE